MEMSLNLASSSTSNPVFLFNPILSGKQLNFPNRHQRIPKRAKPFCVRSSSNLSGPRQTLSSNWDVSRFSVDSVAQSPSRLPSFEELDTTNMLLRQRIVFLGSQIVELSDNCMKLNNICINLNDNCSSWCSLELFCAATRAFLNLDIFQVDDMTADLVISQLLLLDAEDSERDITLFINSPGGSITAGMGIYDAMKQCKADVSTVCFGLAASMGAFLLASGSKGKRYCMPNSKVMIHQPLGTAGGKATEMSIRIREMMYHKIKLNKIFSRITGKPESEIEGDTDRDNFLNPWEAKEYGLVDAVIDDGKPGLIAPIGDGTPPPKTKVWDFWKVEGTKKDNKNLPTEQSMIQNGSAVAGE
ncbi:unnamed protein product [Thlaspi arvense]|uniref:ATP-dependent Clp protease proteolytic subunit n=1 Tax=Thlaspi arvense TaxID=13288 RepID=A0AAU9SGU3_THLAR|nr:unnamed protein product [Thlaspi arvense]